MRSGDPSGTSLTLDEGFDLAVRSRALIAAWVASRSGGPGVDEAAGSLLRAYSLDQALAVLTCLVEVYARQQADREGEAGSAALVARHGFDQDCGTDPAINRACCDLVVAVAAGDGSAYRQRARRAVGCHGPAVLPAMGRLGAGVVRLIAEHEERSPLELLAERAV